MHRTLDQIEQTSKQFNDETGVLTDA